MEALSFVFIITSILIILTPGQDMILVISRSIAQGRGAGIMTALGVSVGLLGHTALATLGLGALLLASEMLFTLIKFIGAGYLIYLGIKLLKSTDSKLKTSDLPTVSYKKMFLQGAISNIANPKITIFYFSYLPQFVVQDAGHTTLQIFMLGATFAIITFFLKAPIGYISGSLSTWIKERPTVLNRIYKSSGLIFIALGLKLALEERV